MAESNEVPIRRRSTSGTLDHIAESLEAALETGDEAELRKHALAAAISLRMLAEEIGHG